MAPVTNIDGDLRLRVYQSKGREERGSKDSLLRIDNSTFPLSFRVSSKKWSVKGKGRGTRETQKVEKEPKRGKGREREREKESDDACWICVMMG